jgi:asparagine synthase (glutamine-hydrolysing)
VKAEISREGVFPRPPDALGVVDLAAVTTAPWRRAAEGAVEIWMRGNIDRDMPGLARALAAPQADVAAIISAGLRDAYGHFAFIARGPQWACAAVDWVRSIPLFFAPVGGIWAVDDRAYRLRCAAGLDPSSLDRDAALAVAMAGYTIDSATLYRGLEMLGPGELAVFRAGAPPQRTRYYTYQPWRVRATSSSRREAELAETTLEVVERMIGSLAGRPLVVPLSAGYDSRLIASAARHLGFKDLRCFAYGRAGNFEAEASRAVAERLGYPWRFVPLDLGALRSFFSSRDYRSYLDYADTCASVPFVQDMTAIAVLKAQGYVPADAVFANGNTGDYISGMHIPKALSRPPAAMTVAARKARILDALTEKHFALWQFLRTPENLGRIQSLLWQSIERAGGALEDPAADHGLYEYAEFQNRQCKYVITGQRTYEFLGHEWRLPLWDNAYLRFWEGASLSEKAGQGLYDRTLHAANWGGAWQGVPVNRKTIRPRWLIPLRLAAKLAHVPLGRERWHRFERRYFQYWMDLTCNSAAVPYRRVATDRRGARHVLAWLAELYLERHALQLETAQPA